MLLSVCFILSSFHWTNDDAAITTNGRRFSDNALTAMTITHNNNDKAVAAFLHKVVPVFASLPLFALLCHHLHHMGLMEVIGRRLSLPCFTCHVITAQGLH